MSRVLKAIEDYPDVSFIDDETLEGLEEKMISWFKEKYKEKTGKDITLGQADARRLILQTGAYYIYQALQRTDEAGKMGLLKYSKHDYLDNLGVIKTVSRNEARGSTVTLRYSMNSARASATPIPEGSKATAGDGVLFSTTEYAEIPAGSTYVDVPALCDTEGADSNVYAIGEISKMATTVPFIDTVTNTTKAQNGRDEETDEDLKERIYLAPESYTSAGSKGAYEYYVRTYDSTIEDVYISTPSPRVVNIKCILAGGELPEEEYLTGLADFLDDANVKMLTDQIVVEAPETVDYELGMTYYINQSDSASAVTIQTAVNAAVAEYISWQKTKIGRDINPDELVKLVKNAGAKRVVITEPSFTTVPVGSVANLTSQTVTYGGLEND